jgi:hypothetical protein
MADAHAAVATLTTVVQGDHGELPADVVARVHTWLVRREAMAYEDAALNDLFETAASLLRAERDSVADWRLRCTGFRAIAGGLAQTARASRRAMDRASSRSSSADYHAWRQRVKDHWLQTRLLQARCRDGLALDERRLEALDGYLGECHNCTILGEVLTSDSTLDRSDAVGCLRAVRRYERKMRRCAHRLGEAIYRETPTDFVKRVRRLWRSARRATSQPRGRSWRSAA